MVTRAITSFDNFEERNYVEMNEEQRKIEAIRLKNTFNRAYLLPTVSVFIDVQIEAARAALEDPKRYKLDCAKDYTLEKKFYDNFSKVKIGDSRVKDLTNLGDTITHDKISLVEKFIVGGDEFSSYVQFNCEEEATIFLSKPRGVRTTLRNTIPNKTQYELQSAFNIYSGESFSIALRLSDVWVALTPVMTEGKNGGMVELWFWTPETGILKDDASKYLDVSPILNLFRG